MIRFEKRSVFTTPILAESSLPDLSYKENNHLKSRLGPYEELFAGYGHVESSYPYRQLDRYAHELTEQEIDVCVLENEHLRAEFLPGYGGRLWSLFDKAAQKELFYKSRVLRICNLAFRNAWFAGGVEWNCGVIGHSPFTSSPVHAVSFQTEDGLPVLRMYQFERIRRIVYQMDFYLKSSLLHARFKIINPHDQVVPMYWWSTAAVCGGDDVRVVVRADEAYTKDALFTGTICMASVPYHNGVDITYPSRIPVITDYFWRVPDDAPKYVCVFDGQGQGVMQTSTGRLKGRKVFSWGMRPGADQWQRFLAADDEDGRYFEVQAGLARTQYECLPMPPRTTWEWLEVYGAIQADGRKVQGPWPDAMSETERQIERLMPRNQLEEELIATRESIGAHVAGRPAYRGDGFGALELRLHNVEAYAHLEFGSTDETQSDWVHLLEHGRMPDRDPDDTPPSWTNQSEWIERLERAVAQTDRDNWYAHLHLGVYYLQGGRPDRAEQYLSRSMALRPSCWALCAQAELARRQNRMDVYADLCRKAALLKPDDPSIAVQAMRAQVEAGRHEHALALCDKLPRRLRELGRIKFYTALAHVSLGNITEAEALLLADGGLLMPDIREGEVSVTDLWLQIERAKRGGAPCDEELSPPLHFDFRVG